MAHLSELSQDDFPLTFTCSTGEIVFGQVQCVLEGLEDPTHVKRALPERLPVGGTILQNKLNYRLAARSGTWKVARAYSSQMTTNPQGVEEERKFIIGFVIHHESVSPVEYLRRASVVGINHNNTIDDGIVYVNRYDWSWHHGSRNGINAALYPRRPWTTQEIGALLGGRLVIMDASQGNQFKDILRSSFLERKSYAFTNTSTQDETAQPFGFHLVSQSFSEYELGWIGFSGQKHSTFTESDEAVAFVYDGAYHGLSLWSPTEKLYVENELARSGLAENAADPAQRPNGEGSDDEEYVYEPRPTSPEDSELETETDEEDEISDDDEEGSNVNDEELASLSLPDQYPIPTITSIDTIWGLGIAIHGTTLRPTTAVEINDEPVPFEVVSNQTIQARIPPNASGQLVIRVHNPSGSSNTLTHPSPCVPSITHITPTKGSKWGGTTITIHGHNFNPNNISTVLFDHTPSYDLRIISTTQLTITSPASTGFNNTAQIKLSSSAESDETHSFFDKNRDICAPNPSGIWFTYEKDDIPPADGYEAAMKTFKQQLGHELGYRGSLDARVRLSEVYDKLGDTASRIALWEDAVRLRLTDGELHRHLAAAYASSNEYEKAIESYNKALELGSDHKDIFIGLSDVYRKIGDDAKADEMSADGERIWAYEEKLF
ncbi:hypothetical protein CVT24_005047 [Panaeolus cyanescens]|uniref:IPT/TIG domain-containing protein n=1 Tax=Panaeolus cyanescens TaxID=181874 RepID=A0A409VPS5_9AGAR|nr:hypothetical protein CVT24_005047 [Panaeolus cyanescens]